jgi:LuxR family maltose regulon positive regulatory protein
VAEGSAQSLAEAAGLLHELQQTARTGGSRLHLVELLALQAVLHDQQGERDAALAVLDEALTVGRPSRPIRLFTDLGVDSTRRLASLLRQLDQNGPTHGYIPHILAALPAGPASAAKTQPVARLSGEQHGLTVTSRQELLEPLTARELEILAQIEQGLSNKQIAERLVLAEKTVENHTYNIYQKLAVRNRIQAVRRANELHLLPPH